MATAVILSIAWRWDGTVLPSVTLGALAIAPIGSICVNRVAVATAVCRWVAWRRCGTSVTCVARMALTIAAVRNHSRSGSVPMAVPLRAAKWRILTLGSRPTSTA